MNDLADFFKKLLDTSDWPPRWHCGKWTEFHGWLYIVSDLLIWSAYFAIPLIIIRFVTRKKDQRFTKLYFLFAAFILACGATHFMDAVMFWFPAYRLSALLRAITGVISWITVFYLVKLLPYAFSLKSAWQLSNEIENYRNVEQELKEANRKLKEAEIIGGFGHFEWKVKDNSLVWSDSLRKLYDIPDNIEIKSYEDFISLMPANKRDNIKKELNSYIINKDYKDHYRKLTDKNGNEKILFARGKIILDQDGNVDKVLGTVQDLTAIKRQEQLLKQTQDTFRNIFEHAAIGMALVSTEGKFIDANDALCKMLGYEKSELQLMNFQVITYGPDLTLDLQHLSEVLDGQINNYKIEKRYIKKDGSIMWAILSVSLIKDAKGKPDFFISQITDITSRKEQELELAQSRENLKNVFKYSPVGMALINTEGKWFDINQALCDMLGYTTEELLNIPLSNITHAEDALPEKELINQLLQKIIDTYRIEKRYFRKDGSTLWGLCSANIVWNNLDQPLFLIMQVIDITENKKLITQLEEKNYALEYKISQVNEFNRIIGHNLRSPAASLISMSEFIEDDNKPEDKIFLISKIKDTATTIISTLDDLKEYVDIQLNRKFTLSNTDIHSAIEYATGMLKKEIEETDAEIIINLEIEKVLFPKVYMESMFYNLLSNSLKYRNTNVPLRITITSREEKGFDCIIVSDNGIGIDLNRYRDEIFKYKKTFHTGYDSTGVGLFLVKNHLSFFGGSINVESSLSRGATFTIYLKKDNPAAN